MRKTTLIATALASFWLGTAARADMKPVTRFDPTTGAVCVYDEAAPSRCEPIDSLGGGSHTFAPVLRATPGRSDPTGTPLRASGSGATLNDNANFTGRSLLQPHFSGYLGYDGLSVVADLPAGSTIYQTNAMGAYCIAHASQTSPGASGQCVQYFGAAVAAGQASSVWGSNWALIDDPSRTAVRGSTKARTLVGSEADFYVNRDDSSVDGFTVAGNSLVAPSYSAGFTVKNLSQMASIPWQYGFLTQDGAATNAVVIGAQARSGASVYSQFLHMRYRDAKGTPRQTTLQADPSGGVHITNAGGSPSLSVDGQALTSSVLAFSQAGKPLWKWYTSSDAHGGSNDGSNLYLSFHDDEGGLLANSVRVYRNSGQWTFFQPTNFASGVSVGGTAGVSCSGPPTAAFQVTNGIVTHC